MRNVIVMDQLILFHKPKKSERWEDDALIYSSNKHASSNILDNRSIFARFKLHFCVLPSGLTYLRSLMAYALHLAKMKTMSSLTSDFASSKDDPDME